MRSTIVVGLTKNKIIPFLTNELKIPDEDINIAFAPERTVEGNALEDLLSYQILGCNNDKSKHLSINFSKAMLKNSYGRFIRAS